MRPIRLVLLFMIAIGPSQALAQSSAHPAAWTRPFEPFRILGNVHYVGTEGLSAYLITGPRGHVLIDGGLPQSAPQIAANIRTLGFRLRDVKYLLINHGHYDHAGGLAELKRLTGAKLLASAGDKADLEAGRTIGRPELDGFPPVKVDRLIRDGERVRLGPITLTSILTPGHTAGSTSWSTRAAGKRVLFASSISVAGQKLVGDRAYPTAAADLKSTFAKLRAIPADVYLNFHGEGFDLANKRARQRAGQADAFVDPAELARRVDAAERAFSAELAVQQRAAASR